MVKVHIVMRNNIGFLASALLRHSCSHHVASGWFEYYYVGQDSSEIVVLFLPLTPSATITGMCQWTQPIIVHDLRLFCPDIWNNSR